MTRIATNVASLRGLRSLNRSNQLLDTSLQRLSTGLQINSGKDNPAGLIAGETLRLQVSAIEQSIKNSNRANNVIATADAALGEIGGLLNQIRGLVQEGLNDGALSLAEKEANQQQIDAALSAINRISSNTTFAGDRLLDGSKAFNTTISTTDSAKLSDFQINQALLGSTGSITLDAEVTQTAQKAELRYAGGGLTSAATLEIGGSNGTEVVFLGANSDVGSIRDAINGVADSTGVTARTLDGFTQDYAARDTLSVAANSNGVGNLVITDENGEAVGNYSIEFATSDGDTNADALSVGLADNVIRVKLADDAANSNDIAANSLTNIAAAINTALSGKGLVATTTGSGDARITANTAETATAGTDSAAITFSDIRPSGTAGNINVQLVNGGASQALSVAVNTVGNDSTIVVNLATDAGSNVTSTLDDIRSAIAQNETAASLVETSISGDSTRVARAEASTQLTSSNRVSASFQQAGDSRYVDYTTGGQTLRIHRFENDTAFTLNFLDNSNSNAAATAAEAANVLDIDLADGGAGPLATAANNLTNIAAAVNNADIGFYAEVISGDGTAQQTAAAANAGTHVANVGAATLNFTDVRAAGSDIGTISVNYVDPGANSQALSIEVAEDGDNRTITVNLATDANGNVTTTASQLATALGNSTQASALVSLSVAGDGNNVIDTARNFAFDASGGVLQLESSGYGTGAEVNVNVLAGSFATTLNDGTTASTRDVGRDIAVNINGQAAYGEGLNATLRTSTVDVTFSLQESANVEEETFSLSVNGGGSLFQIGQEVTAAGQLGLGIEAVNTARLGGISGKLYELGTGNGKSLLDVGTGGVTGTQLVDILEEALDRVSTLRGRLGAVQKNVIETNIATLGVALENINEARSQIVDTDFAVETANLTKAQILSQSGISVLAIANQTPSQVLSLLG